MAGRWSICVLFVSCFFLMSGCRPVPKNEADAVTPPSFPPAVNGWVAAGEAEHYDTESIYAYIDGHAEVYMAYGMKRCVSQRYSGSGGGAEIVIDLFEMASSADAYGVFSHDRAGEVVDVGRGGVFRHGWLSFWKGSWYGSVYSTDGDEGSRDAVLELGRAAAETLADGGDVPALVSFLPADGLDPASVCFLRSPQILNAHVFVGGNDPFALGPDVEAVVGTYDRNGVGARVLVVHYPNDGAAETVELAAREDAAPDENRPPMVIGRHKAVLAAVIGTGDDEFGESLLVEVLGGEQ